jgi:predicted phage terminase large subunit-like protein
MTKRRSTERGTPTKQQLVRALVDPWFFLDLLGFHGGTANFGEIHHELADWVFQDTRLEKRSLVIMPRGHLKTTIATVGQVLHDIYVNPNIRIYIGSANQALAKAILREIVANLVDPWAQDNIWNNRPHFDGRLIPLMDRGTQQRRQVKRLEETGEYSEYDESMTEDMGDDGDKDRKVIWRQDAIQVIRPDKLKEPTVVIGSCESPATGFHYDKIYFDDIINFENYDKKEKIERLDVWRNDMFSVLDNEFFDEDLFNSLKGLTRSKDYKIIMERLAHVGGDCIVVGTRYFKHDWYKQIIDDPESEYRVFWRNIYKNGEDASEGYLWHERWNEEVERKRRKEVSKKHFYAQFLNKVIVEGDTVLPFDSVQFIHANQIEHRGTKWFIALTKDDLREIKLHCVVDPAATCNKNSDFTCITVGGKDKQKNLYVLECKLLRVTSDKWIKEMYALLDKYELKAAHLETVAFAVALKDVIRSKFEEYYPISIREYKPTQAASKKERIESGLDPLLANRMLYMTTWLASFNELTDQFNFFPSDTVHDDGLDAIQTLNEVSKPALDVSNHQHNQKVNTKYGGYR